MVCPRKTGECQLIKLLNSRVQENVVRHPVRQAAAKWSEGGGDAAPPLTEHLIWEHSARPLSPG